MIIAALIDELNGAVAHGTVGQRAKIVHRITELFAAGAADYSDDQIGLFDDVCQELLLNQTSPASGLLCGV